MSCNNVIPLQAVADKVATILAANYIDKDDPRITNGVFTSPSIRGGFLLDPAAKLAFCGYVQRCGVIPPYGKEWLERPIYPDQILVSREDSGETKLGWERLEDAIDLELRGDITSGRLITDEMTKVIAPPDGVERNQASVNAERMSVKGFGAKGDGVTDDTLALQKAANASRRPSNLDTSQPLYFPYGEYVFSDTLDLSRCNIISDNATLLKNFSGDGVLMAGAATYTTLEGNLNVIGHGEHEAPISMPSDDPTSNGVVIKGRAVIKGKLFSARHKGSGVVFAPESTNMNKCYFDLISTYGNAEYGILGKGDVSNDISVWELTTEAQSNYKGNVYLEDDFQGRNWKWFCYTENTQDPNAISGLYVGRLRSSEIFSYGEEQTITSHVCLYFGANCQALQVTNSRGGAITINNAPSEVSITNGVRDSIYVGEKVVRAGSLGNASEVVKLQTLGRSSTLLNEELIRGDGYWGRRAYVGGSYSYVGLAGNRVELGVSSLIGRIDIIKENVVDGVNLGLPALTKTGHVKSVTMDNFGRAGASSETYATLHAEASNKNRATYIIALPNNTADCQPVIEHTHQGIYAKRFVANTTDFAAVTTSGTITVGHAVRYNSLIDGVITVERCTTAESASCIGVVTNLNNTLSTGVSKLLHTVTTGGVFVLPVATELLAMGDILTNDASGVFIKSATDPIPPNVFKLKVLEIVDANNAVVTAV